MFSTVSVGAQKRTFLKPTAVPSIFHHSVCDYGKARRAKERAGRLEKRRFINDLTEELDPEDVLGDLHQVEPSEYLQVELSEEVPGMDGESMPLARPEPIKKVKTSKNEAHKPIVSVPKKLCLKRVEPSIVPGLNLKPVSPTDIAHLVTKKGMKRDSEAMTDIPYDNQPDYKPSRFPTSHIRPSSDVNSINEPYYVPSIIKNGQREFGKFDKLESRAAMVTSSETSSERATTPMKAAEMALNDQVDIEMDTNFTIKWPSQMPRKPEGDRMVPIEDDEDTAFFKYMAFQTRQMKRGAKKKFFRQIQDLLSEYESAEEQM